MKYLIFVVSIFSLIKLMQMSQEMDDLKAAVTAQTTVGQSAITLLQGLKSKLDGAMNDPAALRALSAELGSDTQAMSDAITANTPAENPVPPTT